MLGVPVNQRVTAKNANTAQYIKAGYVDALGTSIFITNNIKTISIENTLLVVTKC